jgi:hypothetical protein
MDRGYIKLFRKLRDSDIWSEQEPFDFRSAWVDLLLCANHRASKARFRNETMTIERGQIWSSEAKLAERWLWHRNRVRRFFKILEQGQALRQVSGQYGTIITICNYETYQGSLPEKGQESGQVLGQDRDRSGTRLKNSNHSEKDLPSVDPEKESKPKKKATSCPENFEPTEDTLAVVHGIAGNGCLVHEPDVRQEFVSYWLGEGKPKKDWQHTYRNWWRSMKRRGQLPGTNKVYTKDGNEMTVVMRFPDYRKKFGYSNTWCNVFLPRVMALVKDKNEARQMIIDEGEKELGRTLDGQELDLNLQEAGYKVEVLNR